MRNIFVEGGKCYIFYQVSLCGWSVRKPPFPSRPPPHRNRRGTAHQEKGRRRRGNFAECRGERGEKEGKDRLPRYGGKEEGEEGERVREKRKTGNCPPPPPLFKHEEEICSPPRTVCFCSFPPLPLCGKLKCGHGQKIERTSLHFFVFLAYAGIFVGQASYISK